MLVSSLGDVNHMLQDSCDSVCSAESCLLMTQWLGGSKRLSDHGCQVPAKVVPAKHAPPKKVETDDEDDSDEDESEDEEV